MPTVHLRRDALTWHHGDKPVKFPRWLSAEEGAVMRRKPARSAHNLDLRTTRTIRSAIEIRAPHETVWRRADRLCRPTRIGTPISAGCRAPVSRARASRSISRPPGGRLASDATEGHHLGAAQRASLALNLLQPEAVRRRAPFPGFEPITPGSMRLVQDETFSGVPRAPFTRRLRLAHTRKRLR